MRRARSSDGIAVVIREDDRCIYATEVAISDIYLDSRDALQKLARLPHVDLLVTDHLMPAMTEPELATTVARALSVPAAG